MILNRVIEIIKDNRSSIVQYLNVEDVKKQPYVIKSEIAICPILKIMLTRFLMTGMVKFYNIHS